MINKIISNSFSFPLLIISLVFLIGGFIITKYPPKKINYFYGYRTSNSMYNKNRWDLAQLCLGKELKFNAFILFSIACFGLIFSITEEISAVINISVIILIAIRIFIKIENELNKTFGEIDK